jgi:hypothetical protein
VVPQDEETWSICKRQHLVGIPRGGKLVERADFGQGQGIELIDGGADRRTDRANQRAVEHSCAIRQVRVLILRTDLIDVGDKLAACLVEQVHQGMTIEVDPYRVEPLVSWV